MTVSQKEKDIYTEALEKFQCERNREAEESFARTFSESYDVRLFFINENKAYTDGKNIVVDPAFRDIYKDSECLEKIEELLDWPQLVSKSPWNSLKMVTRGQTLHESLHLIYSNLPGNEYKDAEFTGFKNGLKVMASISNIIEDAYIEAVGASVYDNISLYLLFNRLALVLAKKQTAGTSQQRFETAKPDALKGYEPPKDNSTDILSDEERELWELHQKYVQLQKKLQRLIAYFDYMASFLLYPMFEMGDPDENIAEYVEKTKQLFLDGSIQDTPNERYDYCKKIYEILRPLIPEDEEGEVGVGLLPDCIGGKDSHGNGKNSIGGKERQGKAQAVTTRLFSTLDGKKKEQLDTDDSGLLNAVARFTKDEKAADEIMLICGCTIKLSSSDVGAPPVHKDIQIHEYHPKINLNMRKAYQNIYNEYKLNINSYNSRFLQLLRAQVPVKESGFQFGSGIDSKRLGDSKGRIWFRSQMGIENPDLAVLLLVDGSGSMSGERRNSAMISSMILHEVLKKQGIEHAIVEHRGGFSNPKIDVNILVNFNGKEEEKYNILQLAAKGDNRDGLALYWAERYMHQKTFCEKKLIIVLSDGQPAHAYDDYYGYVAHNDTANAVKKILKRGTSVIAVALDNDCENDDADSTFNDLKDIYPHLIQCKDLKRLTGQILQIVSKQLL